MLTKLEAVNQMLDAIGEAPVSSLSVGYSDAKKAERILDRVSKEVQAVGWNVNTDEESILTADVSGNIVLADSVLRVKPVSYSMGWRLIPRRLNGKRCLWDEDNKTFVFTAKVYADVTYLFDFEDLTPELQTYITLKAAREFQDSDITSVVIDKKLAAREAEAWAKLEDAEADTQPINILTDCPAVRAAVYRNNRLYGV